MTTKNGDECIYLGREIISMDKPFKLFQLSTERYPALTEEQLNSFGALAQEMAAYREQLVNFGLPAKLCDDLVRDWHAVRISAALAGEERADV